MDVLIPIAKRKDTGEWLEVSDAKKGRACGCICPSCGQGLIAKHGDINTWHFAHDSESEQPDVDCELSFFSCCHVYIIELFRLGKITEVLTPALQISDSIFPYLKPMISQPVTEPSQLNNWSFLDSTGYDVSLMIGKKQLNIQFDYPQHYPDRTPKDLSQGLLTINLKEYRDLFYAEKGSKQPLRDFLIEVIGFSTAGKTWAHHPRTVQVRAKLEEVLAEKRAFLEQDRVSVYPIPTPCKAPNPGPHGEFSCLSCGLRWQGYKNQDSTCVDCRTHLFSRFKSDYDSSQGH